MNNLVAQPNFQSLVKKIPLVKRLAANDGRKIYDLVSGFVYSQVLLAMVELKLLKFLLTGKKNIAELSDYGQLDPNKMLLLCNAAAAIGLIKRKNNSYYALTRLGAAIEGVKGLEDMIMHHKILYRDLQDPVRLLKGNVQTELKDFWSYVGNQKKMTDVQAVVYSNLMSSSQHIVAEETLDLVNLKRSKHLIDIGGGDGTFLSQVRKRYSKLDLTLFDLPSVIKAARENVENGKLTRDISLVAGNFIEDEFPLGGDVIFFNRVLYDHNDSTVSLLLRKAFTALKPGGFVMISEPMAGSKNPTRSGDTYFGFYTLAMTSGKPRAKYEHFDFLRSKGFEGMEYLSSVNNFLTSVIVAKKPLK